MSLKKTKIDWCDSTVNFVIGCKNGCEYCYARKINDRFHFIKNWNEPQFFPNRFEQLKSKKPKSIFMDSMSDIAYWKDEWCDKVIDIIKENKQHNYIFLTKSNGIPYPFFYASTFGSGTKRMDNGLFDNKSDISNCYFGKSVTNNKQVVFTDSYNFDFLSIEPIMEDINLNLKSSNKLKLIIIGAETGNRVGKIVPKKEWIDGIVKQADSLGITVFMKSSLKEIMGSNFRQDKLIWGK